MQPTQPLGPGHEFARRGTVKAARVAGQVRLVELAMSRHERRQRSPGPGTQRTGESCLDVRQDTFQAFDDPDSVAASAVLAGEVYVDDTSLRRAEPARLGRRT
jgi:hypothetical protein